MILNKDTFSMVAMKAYDNPSCKTIIEFEEDLSKFSNLVRICARDMGPIETHLLLNAVVTLFNVFNTSECTKMMFFKVRPADWHKLKTVLVFLERMPPHIGELNIIDTEIELCQSMIDTLRKI